MIRSELETIALDYHGAIDFAELAEHGISPDDVIDFSVNSNPFGPADAVWKAINHAVVDRYPDKACLRLREEIGGYLGRPIEQILVGNGTAELLWMVAFACLQRGDKVLIVAPTFGEYARNARLMGAEVVAWQARPEDDFAVDVAAIETLLREVRPKLCHLCNPNNPTGKVVATETIAAWADAHPETLFVIDEAYLAFVVGLASAATLQRENIVVLRSMTKDYTLAGLRLGYAVGNERLIAGLARVQVPWSVNNMAQATGVAALSAEAEYQKMWQMLRVESGKLRDGLQKWGYAPVPSETHYFLMDVGDGRAVREQLLQRGMLVRLCESYQLPRYVRIAARTHGENERLVAAFRRMRKMF